MIRYILRILKFKLLGIEKMISLWFTIQIRIMQKLRKNVLILWVVRRLVMRRMKYNIIMKIAGKFGSIKSSIVNTIECSSLCF